MPFPVCGDRQIGVYFRPERGGLITAANTGADDRVADPAIFRDEPDPLYGRWILERLASRLPVLRGGEVVGSHAGVYLSGADDFPVIGAVPGVAGLYCVMDTAGNGMTSSPGLGRALAESIVLGKTFTDLHPFRPGRFAEGDLVAAPYRHGDAAARLA
jgi:glycine/D-amino acid oxidase-like deaminating enzyme